MTRDEMMAMEPGRELDVLVMQYIFKAEKKDIGDECYWVSEIDGEEVCWPRWFSPSTDTSAAFEVWEHDRPELWHFDLCWSNGTYFADIYMPDEVIGVRILAQVESESAAEAMVKCRLLAVMDNETN